MQDDLTPILESWPAENGEIRARTLVGEDGKAFIQLRVDLGVLQMQVDDRPDGERPHGFDSILAWLGHRVDRSGGPIELSEHDKEEVVREMLQYYRRRISLIALGEDAKSNDDLAEADACFRRAIRDADHNISLLLLLKQHCSDQDFVDEHLQYRPFILMHRTACIAERMLLADEPEEAIESIKSGIRAIMGCVEDLPIPDLLDEEGDEEAADQEVSVTGIEPFIAELRRLELEIRRTFGCRQTMQEQLEAALAEEDYERAAEIRDTLTRQRRHGRN